MNRHLVMALILLVCGIVVLVTAANDEPRNNVRILFGLIFLVLAGLRFWRWRASAGKPGSPP